MNAEQVIVLLTTGIEMPDSNPDALYSLAKEIVDQGQSLRPAVESIHGLSGAALSKFEGQAADAFADHQRDLSAYDISPQLQGLDQTSELVHGLGVNDQTTNYEIAVTVASFVGPILIILATPALWPYLPSYITAARTIIQQLVQRGRQIAGKLANYLRALWQIVEEGLEEVAQTTIAQLGVMADGKSSGLNFKDILVSGVAGSAVGGVHVALHWITGLNQWLAQQAKTWYGKGTIGAGSELPVEAAAAAILGGGFGGIAAGGIIASNYFMSGAEHSAHQYAQDQMAQHGGPGGPGSGSPWQQPDLSSSSGADSTSGTVNQGPGTEVSSDTSPGGSEGSTGQGPDVVPPGAQRPGGAGSEAPSPDAPGSVPPPPGVVQDPPQAAPSVPVPPAGSTPPPSGAPSKAPQPGTSGGRGGATPVGPPAVGGPAASPAAGQSPGGTPAGPGTGVAPDVDGVTAPPTSSGGTSAPVSQPGSGSGVAPGADGVTTAPPSGGEVSAPVSQPGVGSGGVPGLDGVTAPPSSSGEVPAPVSQPGADSGDAPGSDGVTAPPTSSGGTSAPVSQPGSGNGVAPGTDGATTAPPSGGEVSAPASQQGPAPSTVGEVGPAPVVEGPVTAPPVGGAPVQDGVSTEAPPPYSEAANPAHQQAPSPESTPPGGRGDSSPSAPDQDGVTTDAPPSYDEAVEDAPPPYGSPDKPLGAPTTAADTAQNATPTRDVPQTSTGQQDLDRTLGGLPGFETTSVGDTGTSTDGTPEQLGGRAPQNVGPQPAAPPAGQQTTAPAGQQPATSGPTGQQTGPAGQQGTGSTKPNSSTTPQVGPGTPTAKDAPAGVEVSGSSSPLDSKLEAEPPRSELARSRDGAADQPSHPEHTPVQAPNTAEGDRKQAPKSPDGESAPPGTARPTRPRDEKGRFTSKSPKDNLVSEPTRDTKRGAEGLPPLSEKGGLSRSGPENAYVGTPEKAPVREFASPLPQPAPTGFGGAPSAKPSTRWSSLNVISADTYEGDEREFVQERMSHLLGVNPGFEEGLPGRTTDCLNASIQGMNRDEHRDRAAEFVADPSEPVAASRVPETGLAPLTKMANGYDDVLVHAPNRTKDGPLGLVYLYSGDGAGHFITLHKVGDEMVLFDSQAGKLASLGNPEQVWFSPMPEGAVLRQVTASPNLTTEDTGGGPRSQPASAATDQAAQQSVDIGDATANRAFHDLLRKSAGGRFSREFGADYLQSLDQSITDRRELSFVVNSVLPHGDVGRIREVVESVREGARGLEGRVAFVFGVNGLKGSDEEVQRAIESVAAEIEDLQTPIALVPVVPNGFKSVDSPPYGTLRNDTMGSQANRAVVAAMTDLGTHPYLSFQDFDTGSRRVGSSSGQHIFNHLEDRLNGTADIGAGPIRPLMFSGGYRHASGDQLFDDVLNRLENQKRRLQDRLGTEQKPKAREALERDLKRTEEGLDRLRSEDTDFAALQREFEEQVAADMATRGRLSGNHPLHAYSPEPNLYVDGTVLLKRGLVIGPGDREFGFGKDGAEFLNLGTSLQRENAKEFGEHYDKLIKQAPKSSTGLRDERGRRPRTKDELREDARAQAPERHPVRGVPFLTDFTGATIETDLTRVAMSWAVDAQSTYKLPQNHIDPDRLRGRTFLYGPDTGMGADKKSKAIDGTDFAGYREQWQDGTGDQSDPLVAHRSDERPAVPSGTVAESLGGSDKNVLNANISTMLKRYAKDPNLKELRVGVSVDAKTIVAQNAALSAQAPAMRRHFQQFQTTFLDQPGRLRPVPASSLYAQVSEAVPDAGTPEQVRADTVATGVELFGAEGRVESGPSGARLSGQPATEFTLLNRIDSQLGPLADTLQHGPYSGQRDRGPSDELVGRLLATKLGRPLEVRRPDGSVQRLEPFPRNGGTDTGRAPAVRVNGPAARSDSNGQRSGEEDSGGPPGMGGMPLFSRPDYEGKVDGKVFGFSQGDVRIGRLPAEGRGFTGFTVIPRGLSDDFTSWVEQADGRLRMVREGGGEVPFAPDAVVGVHVEGNRVAIPVKKGGGRTKTVLVGRSTAAEILSSAAGMPKRGTLLLVGSRATDPDALVKLGERLVEKSPRLTVHTGPVDLEPPGRVLVRDNHAMVQVSARTETKEVQANTLLGSVVVRRARTTAVASPWAEIASGTTESSREGYREPRTEYREPRTEYREPRTEYREPRTEYREPRTEYREPRTEYREPRTEYREPRSEYRDSSADSEPTEAQREARARFAAAAEEARRREEDARARFAAAAEEARRREEDARARFAAAAEEARRREEGARARFAEEAEEARRRQEGARARFAEEADAAGRRRRERFEESGRRQEGTRSRFAEEAEAEGRRRRERFEEEPRRRPQESRTGSREEGAQWERRQSDRRSDRERGGERGERSGRARPDSSQQGPKRTPESEDRRRREKQDPPPPPPPQAPPFPNHYETLGVAEDADPQEIRRAYFKAAARSHPDKVSQRGGTEAQVEAATKEFQRFQEAYETLSDDNRRKDFDLRLRRMRASRSGGPRGFGGAAPVTPGTAPQRPGVVSKETFGGDRARHDEFVRERASFVRGVNPGGWRENCLDTSIKVLNRTTDPDWATRPAEQQAEFFVAGPGGRVDPRVVVEYGLPPLRRAKRGYVDVESFLRGRDEDGPRALVYAYFGGGNGHFFTAHEQGGAITYPDGQAESLATLGDPEQVWFSPVPAGQLFARTPGVARELTSDQGAPPGLAGVLPRSLYRGRDRQGFPVDFFGDEVVASRVVLNSASFLNSDLVNLIGDRYLSQNVVRRLTNGGNDFRLVRTLPGEPVTESLEKAPSRGLSRFHTKNTRLVALQGEGGMFVIPVALPGQPATELLVSSGTMARMIEEVNTFLGAKDRFFLLPLGNPAPGTAVQVAEEIVVEQPWVSVDTTGGVAVIAPRRLVIPGNEGLLRVKSERVPRSSPPRFVPVRVETRRTRFTDDEVTRIREREAGRTGAADPGPRSKPDERWDPHAVLGVPEGAPRTAIDRARMRVLLSGPSDELRERVERAYAELMADFSGEQEGSGSRSDERWDPHAVLGVPEGAPRTAIDRARMRVLLSGPSDELRERVERAYAELMADFSGEQEGSGSRSDERWDPHAVLGVPRDATPSQIERAHMARLMSGLAEQERADVERAYAELTGKPSAEPEATAAESSEERATEEPEEETAEAPESESESSADEGPSDKPNHYQVLGVAEDASTADVTKAFRKLALKFHPDKAKLNGLSSKTANRKFQEISAAHEVLSDAKKRATYDRMRTAPPMPERPGPGGYWTREPRSSWYHPDPGSQWGPWGSGRPRGWGGAAPSVSSSAGARSDVVSAETFAGDPAGMAEFVRRRASFVAGVNPSGARNNCYQTTIQTLNRAAHRARAAEFVAAPVGPVDPGRAWESGLPPLQRARNGYDDVVSYLGREDRESPHVAVYIHLGGDDGHFFSLHDLDGLTIALDGQLESLASLGSPEQVWFAPMPEGAVLTPLLSDPPPSLLDVDGPPGSAGVREEITRTRELLEQIQREQDALRRQLEASQRREEADRLEWERAEAARRQRDAERQQRTAARRQQDEAHRRWQQAERERLAREAEEDARRTQEEWDQAQERARRDWEDQNARDRERARARQREWDDDRERRPRTAVPRDHYAVLGLRRDARPGEITAAYRRLALRHHPDRVDSAGRAAATARFQAINEAHEVLSDPRRRRIYDATRPPGFGGAASAVSPSSAPQRSDVVTAESFEDDQTRESFVRRHSSRPLGVNNAATGGRTNSVAAAIQVLNDDARRTLATGPNVDGQTGGLAQSGDPVRTPSREVAELARDEQWQLDGPIDGAVLRARIKELAEADEALAESVDLAFADENLANGWPQLLEGLFTKNLGERANRGHEVTLAVTELSLPDDPRTASTGTSVDAAKPSVRTVTSSSRASTIATPFQFRVPTPYVVVHGRVDGLSAHARGSGLSSATEHRGTTKITEVVSPGRSGRHRATIEITVRKPANRVGGEATTSRGEVTVDVPLKSVPTEPRAATPESPETVELAKFSGTGGIYQAVQDELGNPFVVNDPEARRFREWLAGLDGESGPLLGGRLVRDSFSFKGVGSPVEVAVGVGRVREVHRLPAVGGTVERTDEVVGETTVDDSLTRKTGGALFVGGGDITGASGVVLGPVRERANSSKVSGATKESYGSKQTTKYTGPLDKQRGRLDYVVLVERHDGEQSDGPEEARDGSRGAVEVPGAVTLWSAPRDARWVSGVVPSGRTPAAEQRRQAPDRVGARYHLPEATVDVLVGPALSKLASDGQVPVRDLPEIAAKFRAFVRDHGREIVRGSGARFPLSSLVRGAPDVFLKGTMRDSEGKDLDRGRRRSGGAELTAGHERESGAVESRSTVTGLAGIGLDGIVWTNLKGLTRNKSSQSSRALKQKASHQPLVTTDQPLHEYEYPVDFEVRVGGTWSSPGEQVGLSESGGTDLVGAVHVAAPEVPGQALRQVGAEPGTATGWQGGRPPTPERAGHLTADSELDLYQPAPDLLPTAADMLRPRRSRRGWEWLKLPFIGRRPADFDEHRDRMLRSRPGAASERNPALGALENFTSLGNQTARFGRASVHRESATLKTHNHGSLAGNRELFGRIDREVRLGNPVIVRRDDDHVFTRSADRSTETSVGDKKSSGGRLAGGITLFFPARKLMAVGVDFSGEYNRTRGKSASEADETGTGTGSTRRERGYLVRYEATHELRTSVRRRWQDLLHAVRDGHAKDDAKWSRSTVEMWVPASEVDQVGELSPEDVDLLAPEDAERYRATHPGADQQAGPVEVPDVRPPANVGRGSGDVALHRPEAGRELAQVITAQLDGVAREQQDQRAQRFQPPSQERVDRVRAALREFVDRVLGPPDPRHFAVMNDSLLHSELAPVFSSPDAALAVEEIINGGLPLVTTADTPYGQVEQLVIVRGRLGGGRYHGTTHERRTHRQGGTQQHAAGQELTNSGNFTLSGVLYPLTNHNANLIAIGAYGAYSSTEGNRSGRRNTDAVTEEETGAHHQFVHDLVIDQLDVYPHASTGTYRKILAGWASVPATFGEPQRVEPFTVANAVRTTVPEAEVLRSGEPARTPLAEQRGSLRIWHVSQRRSPGFAPDSIVQVRPFEAPKLRAQLRQLIDGDGDRPALGSKAAGLVAETTGSKLRAHLPSAMTTSGHAVKVGVGNMSKVDITVDLRKRKVLRAVKVRSFSRERETERSVLSTTQRSFGAGPSVTIDTREASIEGANYRPFQQLVETAPMSVDHDTSHELGLSATTRTSSTAEVMYKVSAVPHWHVYPRYGDSIVPKRWRRRLSTGPDEPIEMWVDRKGLADLGFDPDDVLVTEDFTRDDERPRRLSTIVEELEPDEDPPTAEFRARYPQLWGVNAEKYAQGAEDHTQNCGQALIAAEQTLTGGTTIPAAAGGPMTVGALSEHFARAVQADHAEVLAHMGAQDTGAWGAVFLGNGNGVAHVVMAEKGQDGQVRFIDQQQGVVVGPDPREVIGFMPLTRTGTTSLGGRGLAPDLLVGMPARSGAGGRPQLRRTAASSRVPTLARSDGQADLAALAAQQVRFTGTDSRGRPVTFTAANVTCSRELDARGVEKVFNFRRGGSESVRIWAARLDRVPTVVRTLPGERVVDLREARFRAGGHADAPWRNPAWVVAETDGSHFVLEVEHGGRDIEVRVTGEELRRIAEEKGCFDENPHREVVLLGQGSDRLDAALDFARDDADVFVPRARPQLIPGGSSAGGPSAIAVADNQGWQTLRSGRIDRVLTGTQYTDDEVRRVREAEAALAGGNPGAEPLAAVDAETGARFEFSAPDVRASVSLNARRQANLLNFGPSETTDELAAWDATFESVELVARTTPTEQRPDPGMSSATDTRLAPAPWAARPIWVKVDVVGGKFRIQLRSDGAVRTALVSPETFHRLLNDVAQFRRLRAHNPDSDLVLLTNGTGPAESRPETAFARAARATGDPITVHFGARPVHLARTDERRSLRWPTVEHNGGWLSVDADGAVQVSRETQYTDEEVDDIVQRHNDELGPLPLYSPPPPLPQYEDVVRGDQPAVLPAYDEAAASDSVITAESFGGDDALAARFFRERFPDLAGVNAQQYAHRVEGRTRNCAEALIAAEQTLHPASGDLVVEALAGGPVPLGELAERLDVQGHVVQAQFGDVVAHLRGHGVGTWAGVLVRGADGMAHAVLAQRDSSGRIVFADPHRGTTPPVGPHNVLGYLPLPSLGSTPMPGEQLDAALPVGAPAGEGSLRKRLGRRVFGRGDRGQAEAMRDALDDHFAGRTSDAYFEAHLAVELHLDSGRVPDVAALARRFGERVARQAVASMAVQRVRARGPITPEALGRALGVDEAQARVLIEAAAVVEVQARADEGSPMTAGELVERFGVAAADAPRLITEAMARTATNFTQHYPDLGRTPHAIPEELADWFGVPHREAAERIAAFVDAEVRAAANNGRPLTAESLAKKFGPSKRWAADRITAAVRAEAQESVGRWNHRTAGELAAKYGISAELAQRQVVGAAFAAVSTSRGSVGSEVGELLTRGGVDPATIGRHVDALAGEDVRAGADVLRRVTAGGLAARYGRSTEWAAGRIEATALDHVLDVADISMVAPLPELFDLDPNRGRVAGLLGDVVRRAADLGRPLHPGHALFTSSRMSEAASRRLIQQVALADVLGAARNRRAWTFAAMAGKYGLNATDFRKFVNDSALADVTSAAAVGRPFSAAQLAARYGIPGGWAPGRLAAAAGRAVRDAVRDRRPLPPEVLAKRYRISPEAARSEIRAAAPAIARQLRQTGADDREAAANLQALFDMGSDEARRQVRDARNVLDDSDGESVLGGWVPVNPPAAPPAGTAFYALPNPSASTVGSETDSELWDPITPVNPSTGEALARMDFRTRFPELSGVNAEKYSQRREGHTQNCGQSIVAAERTLATGELVTADAGDPMPIEDLERRLGARPGQAVRASRDDVVAHMRGQRADAGALLSGENGLVHAVLVRREPGGNVVFADPQRGVLPEVGPQDVVGYVPLPRLGSTPMQGEPLARGTRVGAPPRSGASRLGRLVGRPSSAEAAFVNRLRSYGVQPPSGPLRFTADQLALEAEQFGVNRERALAAVNAAARAEVRAALERGHPLGGEELAKMFFLPDRWGFDRITDVVREDLRGSSGTVHDLASKYRLDPPLVARAVVAEESAKLRARTGRIVLPDLVKRTQRHGMSELLVRDRLVAAAEADVREAADRMEPRTPAELAQEYGFSPYDAVDVVRRAANHHVAEASDAGLRVTRQDLVRKFGQEVGRFTDEHLGLHRQRTGAVVEPENEAPPGYDALVAPGPQYSEHVTEPSELSITVASFGGDEVVAAAYFRSRFPQLAAVNAHRYAQREPGHVVNCVPSVIAAERTLATGTTVAAGAGDLTAVRSIAGGPKVRAGYDRVVAHMAGQPPGALGRVFLSRPGAPRVLHAALVEKGADGKVRFVDPQRGTIPDVGRHNVIGFQPSPQHGAEPMQGVPLDPDLLVGSPDPAGEPPTQSTNSLFTNAGDDSPPTSHSANSDKSPSVVSGWKAALGSPDASYSAGVDKNGKLVYFKRDRVQATALKDWNDRPIGVTFQTKPEELANLQSFAKTGNEVTRQYTRLYPPGTTVPTPNGAAPQNAKMEWAKKFEDEPFYLNAHAKPDSFEITTDSGEVLSVEGKTFAKVINDSAVFQSAVAENERLSGKPVSSYHLMACSAGKIDGPGGAAHDFQRTESERFGRPQPVYASTETDVTHRLGHHGVLNGGTWRKFSGGPSTPGV
ncbi:DnaJ domain-containing protein [Saccharopolyspora sp. NPDC000359]|uniref:DnaJ domain-containing protein n=1 Tax=Saccharopolyspora sp. NPDC000359 TaxID=3154251 RepID=UPI00331D483E